jgi:hypothetical protein
MGKGVAARISRDGIEKLLARIRILLVQVRSRCFWEFFLCACKYLLQRICVLLSHGFFVLFIKSSLHA